MKHEYKLVDDDDAAMNPGWLVDLVYWKRQYQYFK